METFSFYIGQFYFVSRQLDLLKISMTGGKLDFVGDDLVVDTTPFQVGSNLYVLLPNNAKLDVAIFRLFFLRRVAIYSSGRKQIQC